MTITITLPDEIESQLQRKARKQQLTVEEVALAILKYGLETEGLFTSLDVVIDKIKATPPNQHTILPATDTLAEALRHAPNDPDFDLEVWNREWTAVEAEMKAVTHANSIDEGRG